MKDRASSHGELVSAGIAVKLLSLVNARDLITATLRAFNAFGPAERFEKFATLFVSVEVFKQLYQVHGLSISHG